MAYISEATRNWHIQHSFYDFRCNVASFECKNNFLARGCNRSSKISIWLPDYIFKALDLTQNLILMALEQTNEKIVI